jgi:hypothetical protein
MAVCVVCQKEFDHAGTRRNTCSPECSMERKRWRYKMSKDRISIYVGPGLRALLDTRGSADSVSGVINACADRYGEIVKRNIPVLPRPVWMALMDVLNGYIGQPASVAVQGIPATFSDGIALDGLDKKWGLPPDASAQVAGLTFEQKMAILEISERFWAIAPDMDADQALAQAGAIIEE